MKPESHADLTIRDIAQFAGVSTATVSRFLNGKIQRKKSRHGKLEKVIRESGYQLPRQKDKTRLLFVKGSPLVGFHNELSQPALLEYYLQKNSKELGIEIVTLCDKDTEVIGHQLKELNCSGVVSFLDVGRLPVPTVLLNRDNYYGGLSCVNCDNLSGLVKGLAYLKAQGHDRIAYFCDCALAPSQGDPRRYFMPQAYHIAGIEFSSELIWNKYFKRGEHQPVINEAVKYFLALSPPPTAIFSVGDCYGISFYQALKENGLSVPDDMSIIGFDGTGVCEMLSPSLTTVAKPLEKMAVEALKLVKRLVNYPESTAYKILVEPEVVARNSVARKTHCVDVHKKRDREGSCAAAAGGMRQTTTAQTRRIAKATRLVER